MHTFKPAGLEWFFLNGYLWLTFAVFVAVALYYRAPAKTDPASSR